MLRPPARAGASSSAQHPAVEKAGQPLRRVQKVERRARWRRVDDDQVPLVLGVQLTQLLHRHVLLRAGERRAHGLVERVGEDLLGALGVGVGEHDLVEGPLHVEHHRVQLAAVAGVHALDLARGVGQLGQAE